MLLDKLISIRVVYMNNTIQRRRACSQINTCLS